MRSHQPFDDDKVSLWGVGGVGGRKGTDGGARNTDTTLHQFHRQPAHCHLYARYVYTLCDFFLFSLCGRLPLSLSLFLSVAPAPLSVVPHARPPTIVSRNRARTTLASLATNQQPRDEASSLEICFFVWPCTFSSLCPLSLPSFSSSTSSSSSSSPSWPSYLHGVGVRIPDVSRNSRTVPRKKKRLLPSSLLHRDPSSSTVLLPRCCCASTRQCRAFVPR